MLSDPEAPVDLNFQPQTRYSQTKLSSALFSTANSQNHMAIWQLAWGGVTGPQPKPAKSGFVLEGGTGGLFQEYERICMWECVSSFGVGGPPCQHLAQ